MSAQYRIPIALAKAEGLRGLYFLFGGWHVPAGINFATEACARLSAGVNHPSFDPNATIATCRSVPPLSSLVLHRSPKGNRQMKGF